jgi:hypothetical protein
VTDRATTHIPAMASFMLHHRHAPEECPSAYAVWKGFESPLRGLQATSTCRFGGHEIWWEVDAADETNAMGLLPDYVGERTIAIRINREDIP